MAFGANEPRKNLPLTAREFCLRSHQLEQKAESLTAEGRSALRAGSAVKAMAICNLVAHPVDLHRSVWGRVLRLSAFEQCDGALTLRSAGPPVQWLEGAADSQVPFLVAAAASCPKTSG